MADDCGKVIVHPRWGGASEEQRVHIEVLRATIKQLDELSFRLQELSPQPSWSARGWMIASTPFRMRLTSARKRLGDLTSIRLADEQSAIRWSLELNDLRLEAERRLYDIDACLHMLQRVDASPAERARETQIFASRRSELLKALRDIQHLIAGRFPAALSES